MLSLEQIHLTALGVAHSLCLAAEVKTSKRYADNRYRAECEALIRKYNAQADKLKARLEADINERKEASAKSQLSQIIKEARAYRKTLLTEALKKAELKQTFTDHLKDTRVPRSKHKAIVEAALAEGYTMEDFFKEYPETYEARQRRIDKASVEAMRKLYR